MTAVIGERGAGECETDAADPDGRGPIGTEEGGSPAAPALPTSRDTLLGGRVAFTQPVAGHRTGLEPVLLAASVPARAGDHVLEGGTGAGAGMLCLLARLPLVRATGLEAAPGLVALARDNLAANGFADRGRAHEAVLPSLPAGHDLGPVSHAMANPPWFSPDGTASPDGLRRLARVLPAGALAEWAASLGRPVGRGGTLSLVLPASRHADGAASLRAAGFGAVLLLPLWPRVSREARIVILRGRKGARGPDRIAPGLVLHEADGRYTAAAAAVLRDGAPFPDGASGT